MSSRGFTLVEMALTSSLLGAVAVATYAFMLETRVAGARLEAELELEREAALAGEWIARDVRGADAVEPLGGALEVVVPGERRIVYRVERGALVRADGAAVVPVARGVSRVAGRRGARGWSIDLEMSRALLPGRDVHFVRTIAVGDRR